MRLNINNLLTSLTAIAFILITGGMLAAWKTPITGYEISAFTVTPVFYWVAFVFGIITVFLILLAEVLGRPLPKYLRTIKWVLLAVCMLSLTMLLAIRGIYGLNFNGDTGTHIGNLKDILDTGTVDTVYPNLYYFTIIFHLLTSIDIIYLTNAIPAIFVLIFIVGVFFATREIFQNTRVAAISTLISCALPFGVGNDYTGSLPLPYYIPYVQGLLVFSPFVIYGVYAIVNNRCQKNAYVILGSLLLISALFYHVLVAAILLLFILCVCLGLFLQKKIREKEVGKTIRALLTVAGPTVIVWILWTSYLGYMKVPLLSIYSLLTGDYGSDFSEELTKQIVNTGNLNVTALIDYAVKQFGSTFVLFLILFISIIIVYIGHRKGKTYQNVIPFFIIILSLLGIAGISFISTSSFQPGRLVMFITIIGIIFSGFVFTHLLEYTVRKQSSHGNYSMKSRWVRIFSGCIIAGMIILVFVLGIQTYYPGPEIYNSLNDNTKADVFGMQFYFENGSSEYAYNAFRGYVPSRWDELIYGEKHTSINNAMSPLLGKKISFGYNDVGLIPPHHNYGDIVSIREATKAPGYLVIGASSLANYANQNLNKLRNENSSWLDDDTMHLKYDDTALSIYNNGEFDIYVV